DRVETEFETPVSLNPSANDIAYLWGDVVPESIDLDPATDGQQTSVTVAGGTFELQVDNTVLFMPAAGFSGEAAATYTIRDDFYRRSNAADLVVVVKPNPTTGLMLFSFESGTEGWASANWQTGAGTVSQTGDFATDGSAGLQALTTGGGWFGLNFASPVDLSTTTKLLLDFQTLAAGTSSALAIQVGDSFTWCQSPFGWIDPGQTLTVEFDLLTLACTGPDLSDVRALYLWFSANGTYNMDAVRAE
ncbi:MAG TPA: Ig-like domain-containing protein, partial [Gammaproteobacteria bacterium]